MPVPATRRRWAGVYGPAKGLAMSWTTGLGSHLASCWRTGPGGRGMTCSPAYRGGDFRGVDGRRPTSKLMKRGHGGPDLLMEQNDRQQIDGRPTAAEHRRETEERRSYAGHHGRGMDMAGTTVADDGSVMGPTAPRRRNSASGAARGPDTRMPGSIRSGHHGPVQDRGVPAAARQRGTTRSTTCIFEAELRRAWLRAGLVAPLPGASRGP